MSKVRILGIDETSLRKAQHYTPWSMTWMQGGWLFATPGKESQDLSRSTRDDEGPSPACLSSRPWTFFANMLSSASCTGLINKPATDSTAMRSLAGGCPYCDNSASNTATHRTKRCAMAREFLNDWDVIVRRTQIPGCR